jgi:hypothetical protein
MGIVCKTLPVGFFMDWRYQMNEGFIKLHRKLSEWEWYRDTNVLCLFIHILLLANWEDKKWQGLTVKRGSFITSIEHLAIESGLTTQQTRTVVDKLISTGEINKQTTNKYTLITVNSYNEYQEKQQTNNKQITTTKEYKEVKNKDNRLYTSSNLTFEQVSDGIIKAFNLYLGTKFKSSDGFKPNLEYWLNTYEPKEIEQAISNIKFDKFWKDKMTPTMMFRRKNPQGEPVDYISQLLLVKQKND